MIGIAALWVRSVESGFGICQTSRGAGYCDVEESWRTLSWVCTSSTRIGGGVQSVTLCLTRRPHLSMHATPVCTRQRKNELQLQHAISPQPWLRFSPNLLLWNPRYLLIQMKTNPPSNCIEQPLHGALKAKSSHGKTTVNSAVSFHEHNRNNSCDILTSLLGVGYL